MLSSSVDKPSKYTANKYGFNTPPCQTPSLTWNGTETYYIYAVHIFKSPNLVNFCGKYAKLQNDEIPHLANFVLVYVIAGLVKNVCALQPTLF